MIKLSEKKCIPCEGGIPPFTKLEIKRYLPRLKKGWMLKDEKILTKEFNFQVALLAQADDHHPDMHISYKKVVIELWTHAIGGLSENDFILAAKIDQLK